MKLFSVVFSCNRISFQRLCMCHAGCDMLWFWMILAFICWCEIHLQLGFDYTSDFIRLQILGLPVKRLAGDSWGRFGLIPEMLICIVTPWLAWRLTAFKDMMLACSSPKKEYLRSIQNHKASKASDQFRSEKRTSVWGHACDIMLPLISYTSKAWLPEATTGSNIDSDAGKADLADWWLKLFNTWIMFNPIWEEERKWLSYFQGSSKRSIRPCGHNPVA